MIGFPQRPQNENSGQPSPTTILSSLFLISFLQLSPLSRAYSQAHLYFCGLKLGNANLVLLQLVGLSAKLLGANGVFLLELLDPLQNTVEFSNDGIELLIQLPVHPLVHGFENDVGLIGQQSLHLLSLRVEKFVKFALGGGQGFSEVGFGGGMVRVV